MRPNAHDWAFVFDFDSTIIKTESLDQLAENALAHSVRKEDIYSEIEAITQNGMNGDIPFDESLNARLSLFSARKSMVDAVAQSLKEEISDSILEHQSWIEKFSQHCFVISGGFKEMMYPVCLSLGFKKGNIFGNDFIYDTENKIVGVDTKNPLTQKSGKAKVVKSLNFKKPIAILGDGMTDFEISQQINNSKFFVFTENASRKNVIRKADQHIKHFGEFVNYFQIS